MKNSSLSHQERKYRVVFDGFLAVFGVFGGVVSLRQGLSDKLLAQSLSGVGNLRGWHVSVKSPARPIAYYPVLWRWEGVFIPFGKQQIIYPLLAQPLDV